MRRGPYKFNKNEKSEEYLPFLLPETEILYPIHPNILLIMQRSQLQSVAFYVARSIN